MSSSNDTTDLLKQLRELMAKKNYVSEPIQAYIVPTNDAHSNEYLADCDKFREFISGFTGSVGTAIISLYHACLWVDSRYFSQASQQLDKNWTLMRSGMPCVPFEMSWCVQTLPRGSRIGVDPKMFTWEQWTHLQSGLQRNGQNLVPVITNLVSIIWKDRPLRPQNPIVPLELKFTGLTVKDKVDRVREVMKGINAIALVVSTLDDIAWSLNLRGSDIDYNPVFFSYLVFQKNVIILFVNQTQVTDSVINHLNEQLGETSYVIKDYNDIDDYLKTLTNKCGGCIWFPKTTNYHLTSFFLKDTVTEISPTRLMKSVKNFTEIEGMKNAHIKDAAALCCYFAWLEKTVQSGEVITELMGGSKLNYFRSLQEDFVGLSFPNISASGSNGAIIHYIPTTESDAPITTRDLYLCDSGGQYKDGTTDVTRTMHFGTPTVLEKEYFTRVLKGQLQLGNAIFPSKTNGNQLDVLARKFLWEVGLDFAHGTGHGVGHYLNVHEGPICISSRGSPDAPGLEPGMFLSNEPGFYLDGLFGIRLEDVVLVVEALTPYSFQNTKYLTFETVTLVPKQTKLISIEMLTDKEIELINDYHQRCKETVSPVLEQQGQTRALEWLLRETKSIQR